jgi:L-asparagine oxygenase
MIELPIDYLFSEEENSTLRAAFCKGLTISPYKNYSGFDAELSEILDGGDVPRSFVEFCLHKREANTFEEPYVVLRNCPIDENLPFLDFDEPVIDKRNRKTTYVAEGFMLLYAKLMKQEPIGYANVNDGDIFSDIHPKRDLVNSQSSKTLKPIFFHKDYPNHFVRPDWVNLLGLRASANNEVYTSFVRNKDLIEMLGDDTCNILRRSEFYTPLDEITVYKSKVQLGKPSAHPILGSATPTDIRFFENRTEGLTLDAKVAIDRLIETIHPLKKRVLIQSGDLVGSANNDCLHNKDVGIVRDEKALQERWLMKTVNVCSLQAHTSHFVEGRPRIVNG